MAPNLAIPENQERVRTTSSQNIARVIAIIFLLCAACTVEAQVESGKIVGTVRDASGAILSAATLMSPKPRRTPREKPPATVRVNLWSPNSSPEPTP